MGFGKPAVQISCDGKKNLHSEILFFLRDFFYLLINYFLENSSDIESNLELKFQSVHNVILFRRNCSDCGVGGCVNTNANIVRTCKSIGVVLYAPR